MILLAAGNSKFDLTTLGRTLTEKRIRLVARTYGRGELDSQLERLDESSKWVSHESFPILPQQFDAYEFGLQNELIQLYFANSPGYGIVDMQLGRLPAIHKASVLHLVQSSQVEEVAAVVDIVRLLPDKEVPGETVASIVLKREKKLAEPTKRYVEVSTGHYVGDIRLAPGAYIATFRVQHHGQAIYASNPGGIIDGNVMAYVQRPIPPIARGKPSI